MDIGLTPFFSLMNIENSSNLSILSIFAIYILIERYSTINKASKEDESFLKSIQNFVEAKDNAKYKLLSKEAQEDALRSSERIASIGSGGFNAGIMFTVYQSYLTIYINGITRKNYGMSFNSRANYDYSYPIDNNVKGTPK